MLQKCLRRRRRRMTRPLHVTFARSHHLAKTIDSWRAPNVWQAFMILATATELGSTIITLTGTVCAASFPDRKKLNVSYVHLLMAPLWSLRAPGTTLHASTGHYTCILLPKRCPYDVKKVKGRLLENAVNAQQTKRILQQALLGQWSSATKKDVNNFSTWDVL